MAYADLDTEPRNEYGDLRRQQVVVAFTGKRGSGKSEAVKALTEELGFVELKFADPLKNMIRAMYRTCGVDDETIERKIEGDLKEEPCEWLMGKTPRYAMQTLGTEWRNMIAEDLWAEMFKKAVLSGNLGGRIACSDYRFPKEGEVLDALGAVKYRVTRPAADAATDEASQHASETLIDEISTDLDIENDGTVDDLRGAVIDFVRMGMQLAMPTGGRVSGGGGLVGEKPSERIAHHQV